MAQTAQLSLRNKHMGAHSPTDEESPSTDARVEESQHPANKAFYERHDLLRNIPPKTIKKAWFTLSHMLLEPGAHLLDMGCGNGEISYVMAVLAPQIKITALDLDRHAIARAEKKYSRPNLNFRTADITGNADFENESVDAIVNSFILHEIFSGSHYDDRPVARTLENHFSLLKNNGIMMIHDYAQPPPGEYVLLEMPDTPSKNDTLEQMSEPDLLMWYADHARPREEEGCHGFFIEEHPPRFPKTRLFRLPYKWAYEFIMRKDRRADIKAELHKEYAFYTPREYRKTIRGLGARVLYTAPHWEESTIRKKFEGRFRLYNDDGQPMGAPPTSFIAVAQKINEGRSLRLSERRSSHKKQDTPLRITALRNDTDGRLLDVVCRDYDTTEIIPYRLTPEGRLNIFLHEAVPRAITNTVPRQGKALDGRGWSGHMTEAIAVPTEKMEHIDESAVKDTVLFARDYLGLMPASDATLEMGPGFFPAPDFIEERIQTRYLNVRERDRPTPPKVIAPDMEKFSSHGRIRELDAQSVLNALSVGFIPSGRLETQILALYEKLGLRAESWAECPLVLKEREIKNTVSAKDLLQQLSEGDVRYKKTKGTAGQLRNIQSVFVEEGYRNAHTTGMASCDLSFVLPEEESINKAVVLPLAKSMNGEVMAGIVSEFLPVPQRYKGNGMTVTCPSFTLPKDVTTMEKARKYVAAQFEIPPENVSQMGESYFCHIGLTPLRIFPFAVTDVPDFYDGQAHGVTQYAPIVDLWKLLYWDNHDSFMKIVAMSYNTFCQDSDLSVKHAFDKSFSAEKAQLTAVHSTNVMGLEPDPPKADAFNRRSDDRPHHEPC